MSFTYPLFDTYNKSLINCRFDIFYFSYQLASNFYLVSLFPLVCHLYIFMHLFELFLTHYECFFIIIVYSRLSLIFSLYRQNNHCIYSGYFLYSSLNFNIQSASYKINSAISKTLLNTF